MNAELNPADYMNGEPIVSLEKGEVVTSDSSQVILGPSKAIVAAIGGAVVGGLTALSVGLADGVMQPVEWVAVALATVIGTGLVGGATFATRTTVKGG